MQTTGRNLDIAVQGDGYIAVEARDGGEAYTRAGALDVGTDGTLRTRGGLAVQGEGGPITIPENSTVSIGSDGTVSATSASNRKSINVVGRIKLVNPSSSDLVKGGDGLMRNRDGSTASSDPSVKVVDGTIESSNVNIVEAMVGMISVARQFEMQMRMMSNAEQNSQQANKLLANNG